MFTTSSCPTDVYCTVYCALNAIPSSGDYKKLQGRQRRSCLRPRPRDPQRPTAPRDMRQVYRTSPCRGQRRWRVDYDAGDDVLRHKRRGGRRLRYLVRIGIRIRTGTGTGQRSLVPQGRRVHSRRVFSGCRVQRDDAAAVGPELDLPRRRGVGR